MQYKNVKNPAKEILRRNVKDHLGSTPFSPLESPCPTTLSNKGKYIHTFGFLTITRKRYIL